MGFLAGCIGFPRLSTKLYTLFLRFMVINEFRSFNLIFDFAILLDGIVGDTLFCYIDGKGGIPNRRIKFHFTSQNMIGNH